MSPLGFEVVLAPGSLGVENVHGQCGMVKDHTHTFTVTLCVSQAMAPVSQMAVRINLKLSSATTAPPPSVRPAFRHNSSGNGRPGSTAHFHISVFFPLFSPLPSLPFPLNSEP